MRKTFITLLTTCLLSVFSLPAFACDGLIAFPADSPSFTVAEAYPLAAGETADITHENQINLPFTASDPDKYLHAHAPAEMKNAVTRHGLEVTVNAVIEPG